MQTIQIKVKDYDESADFFTCVALDVPELPFQVPGLVLPILLGEYGEPDELLGRTFECKLP